MTRRSTRIALLALLLPLPLLAHAQSDEQMCRNGLFPRENTTFSLARVTGTGKLHFLDDLSGCPEKGGSACEQRAYVLPGDTLLVSKRRNGFRCAFYPNKGGGSAGWVTDDRIEEIAVDQAPALRQWTGTWMDGDNKIVLGMRGKALHATGEAYWPSKQPSAHFPGGPNLGDLEAVATPAQNTVKFVEGSGDSSSDVCRVSASLVGAWLVVGDNQMCGGENVSFSGVYRRQR
ncbi:hypothetical protein [Paraburkholderia bannensis]|uniref:hypothetical protein n=1 Tax=Paraburkholderia bannensis TaxID=765414 RepID=UPI002ABD1DED|nr:hypothetical protein [Paraburkholderia bannensis]